MHIITLFSPPSLTLLYQVGETKIQFETHVLDRYSFRAEKSSCFFFVIEMVLHRENLKIYWVRPRHVNQGGAKVSIL